MASPVTKADLEALVAYRSYGRNAVRPRRITLKTMADFINANFPEYEARMEDWSGSFDRRPERSRIITSPGKMRDGKVLKVYWRERSWEKGNHRALFSHNPLEAYRSNREVAQAILNALDAGEKAKRPVGERHKYRWYYGRGFTVRCMDCGRERGDAVHAEGA